MYNKLIELLKKNEKTFADISRETGISESVFSNLKTRGGKLSLDNAVKVANCLKIDVKELL